jgi:hypothetical protein
MNHMQTQTGTKRASKHSLTLTDILGQVSYRRVELSDLNDPVYRLRYDAYRREDFIPINSQKVAGDSFDESPNAYCYGVYIGDQLVSSVRFHHVTPDCRDDPCRTMWRETLDGFLDKGQSYIDPSRFTVDHEASLIYPALPFLTLRVVAMAAVHFKTDYCLSAVRLEHAAFYRRVFKSERIGDIKNYASLKFPVYLYAARVPVIEEDVYRRYPVFKSTPEERKALFDTPVPEAYSRYVPLEVVTD